MFFTQEDYKKIEKWLLANSIKDTQFNEAATPLKGNEIITCVQDGKNVKVFLKDLMNQLFLLGVSDFLNVTNKYNARNISLEQAIQLIPFRSRKIGQVITFLNVDNNWSIYQFQGENLTQWSNTSLWVSILGSSSNLVPDEEDLTATLINGEDVLKFKDKLYNPNNQTGLGRKYLRKNIVNGTNILTQDMVNLSNTIYHIQYDYDLNGSTIVIPDNCVLLFKGGSFKNGTITGTNTSIEAGLHTIFGSNILIDGTWNCDNVYDSWFPLEKDSFINLQNLCNLTSEGYYGTVHIGNSHSITIPTNAASIKPNSNTTIILDGSITVNPTGFSNYYIFRLTDKQNITIKGGGSLIGDVEGHTGITGEWGHGIFIQGSYNITISNLQLLNFWGDGIEVDKSTSNSFTSELYLSNLTIYNNRRQGISLLSVKNVFVDNCVIYGIGSIKGTNPKAAIDIEPEGNDIAENVFITNCVEYSNGLGITAHNTVKNVTVSNCSCSSPQGVWHTGDITYRDCSFDNYFNLEGDIVRFVNCDMPVTNIVSSNLIEIDNCKFRSKKSFDYVSNTIALLVFNYSATGISKDCKVRVRNSSFDNTKEGNTPFPLVRKALAKNMGNKDIIFEKCTFNNALSYLYGGIQYGDYYDCLFRVPSLAIQLYADKTINFVGNTIIKNDESTARSMIVIESITKNFEDNLAVLNFSHNDFHYKGVSIIDIIPNNVNSMVVSFLDNSFSTRYISEEETLYINLKNHFDVFNYSNRRLDYQRYSGPTTSMGTPSPNNRGQLFYDTTMTTLNFWDGIEWRNSDGTLVSKVSIV